MPPPKNNDSSHPVRISRAGSGIGRPRKESRPDQPLISIITVVFNGEKHLEQAILSVIGQSYANIEYIVIDGGSTDGTLDILRKYEERIDYWTSESDQGIYDAMNKGVALASGELIGLLNSDDSYLPGTIEEVSNTYRLQTDRNVVIAGQWKIIINDRDSGIVLSPSTRFRDLRICHQAMFVPKNAYERIGLYDTRYRYSADLDMAIRLHNEGYRFILVDKPFVSYRSFGASGKNFHKTGKEQSAIIKKHLGNTSCFLFRIFHMKTVALISSSNVIGKLFGNDAVSFLAKRYFDFKERCFRYRVK